MRTDAFEFLDPPMMADADLSLVLIARQPAAQSLWKVPAYVFHLCHLPTGQTAGRVTFRDADTNWIVNYTGHVGYAVDEPFRGRRYAERSCRLSNPSRSRKAKVQIPVATVKAFSVPTSIADLGAPSPSRSGATIGSPVLPSRETFLAPVRAPPSHFQSRFRFDRQ